MKKKKEREGSGERRESSSTCLFSRGVKDFFKSFTLVFFVF